MSFRRPKSPRIFCSTEIVVRLASFLVHIIFIVGALSNFCNTGQFIEICQQLFLFFLLTLFPMSTAFYTKEILTCFFLVCHFLPKLLTANIKPCIVIESSHIQNEYAHRFGTVLTKRLTLYLVFPVIVIVILAMFTF